MIVDRYERQGLRSNPFAAQEPCSGRPPFFVDRDLPDPPPASSCTLVQAIGAKGAGKSAQVFEWQRKAPAPYHYVPPHPYHRRWARPPIEGLVYGDEIDRMPAPLRQRWFRALAATGATVVAGTHLDLERLARWAGLAVITHRLGPADLATIHAVLIGRVSRASTRDAANTFELTNSEIIDIHRRSRGSIRSAEVLAHEVVARRVHDHDGPSHIITTKAASF